MSDYRDLIYKESLKILEHFEQRKKNQEKLDKEQKEKSSTQDKT